MPLPISADQYPGAVMAIVAVAGLALLALGRRRELFFLALFLLLTADVKAYVFTRLEPLGPFFNLFDLLELLMLCTIGGPSTKTKPALTLAAISLVPIVAAALVGFAGVGLDYVDLQTLRRWATFPILIVVFGCREWAARDVRLLGTISVVAIGLQSARQIAWVMQASAASLPESARTLRFANAGIFLVPAIALFHSQSMRWRLRLMLSGTVALAAIALVLTETRSLWIPQVSAIGIVGMRGVRKHLRGWTGLLVGVILAVVASMLVGKSTNQQVEVAKVFVEGRSMNFSSGSGREEAFDLEMSIYADGSLLEWAFGTGPSYRRWIRDEWESIAWGHNGISSTLAAMGALGFGVYFVWIPWRCATTMRALEANGLEERNPFRDTCGGIFILYLISALMTTPYYAGIGGVLFALFLAVATIRGRQRPGPRSGERWQSAPYTGRARWLPATGALKAAIGSAKAKSADETSRPGF